MIRTETLNIRYLFQAFLAVSTALVLMIIAVADADAQRRRNNDDDQEDDQIERVLSTEVGEQVLEIQALIQPEDDNVEPDYRGAIAIANNVLQDDITPYERNILLRLRGSSKYNLEDYQGAVNDFLAMIATGTLTQDEENTFRINIGQLFMVLERVPEGIQQIEIALNNGATLTTQLAKFMAQAYGQEDRWREGLRYAEFFYENTAQNARTAGDFTLMQAYYQQLDRPQDELRVVRDRLNALPGENTAWQNYISLLARLNREQDAFEATKMAYLNGIFGCDDGNRLLNLAQYYSYYENPFRGASILEREINAGCVEESVNNLETLANMWRQAAEFERALGPLERISDIRGDGETALKLAEAYYQLNEYQQAATWFERALNRGGLDQTGEAWVLLGTVRFELDNRQGALDAFEQGARYPASRRSANDWARFVRGQIAAEEARRLRIEQVRIDECRLTLDQEASVITLVGNPSDFNDVGQPILVVPDRCVRYFNENGIQIRQPGMSDDEAAEYAEEAIAISREQAEAALARAG